jgi:hypothetical protein
LDGLRRTMKRVESTFEVARFPKSGIKMTATVRQPGAFPPYQRPD